MWGWEIKICTQILHRGKGHVISCMRNDDLHWSGTLEPNISKTAGDTWSQWSTCRKWLPGNQMVIWPMTSR